MATHYADEAEGSEPSSRAYHRPGAVTCDVLTLHGGVLADVPVLQRGSSVNNGSLWVPRGATTTLDGTPLQWESSPDAPSVDPEQVDGEWVLVDFIEGNPQAPIILGSTTHPRTQRPQDGATPKPLPSPLADGSLSGLPDGLERHLAHQGTVVRVDRVGNVRVDTTRAGIADDGQTDLAGGVPAGHVDVDVADGASLVVRWGGTIQFRITRMGGQLHLDIFGGARPIARLHDFVTLNRSTSPLWAVWVEAVTGALGVTLPTLQDSAGATAARLAALEAWAATPPPPNNGRPPYNAAAAGAPEPVPGPEPFDGPFPFPRDSHPGGIPLADGPQAVGLVTSASGRIRGA